MHVGARRLDCDLLARGLLARDGRVGLFCHYLSQESLQALCTLCVGTGDISRQRGDIGQTGEPERPHDQGVIGIVADIWKPKAWKTPHRFLFIRTRVKQQQKEPIQLNLFVPHAYGYEFKGYGTNKPLGARKALVFHNGRGSQEGIFAELKSDNALGYIPTRTWVGNQIFLLSVLLAHNLGRELQMIAHPPSRATLEKRPALWVFERLDTFRRRILQRAGRLIRPQGQLTLSMSANTAVQEELLHYLDALQAA